MSVDDTLCFADFDVVTGPPTVDGYTGIHDDFVITSESDAGYVRGCRLTYGSGSAFPPVIFNGVKNGNFLNLAFFCRLDYTFDTQDVVVIALRPQKSNPDQSTARRIDIFPVYEGVGADEKNVNTGGPAGAADTVPPGVPPGVDYHIRTDHPAQNFDHYRGRAGAGNPWTTINPDSSTYDPGFAPRVRSWLPPVPTQTTSVGSQTLPTSTFNVADTSAFASAGVFAVTATSASGVSMKVFVKYTGKTTTSFTGCTGGSGTVAAGSGVSIPEVAWSIELQVPLTIAAAGGTSTQWIDIQDSFGLYFAVIRVGKTPISGGTPSQTFYSTQFTFPANTTNFLTGLLNESTVISPNWYGTGLIPAFQIPPGSNLGLGVHFANDAASVGVRDLSAPAGTAPGTLVHRISGDDNRLVAQLANNGGSDAHNVKAEFRFANWGLPAATFPSWDSASDHGANADQTSGVTVPASGAVAEVTYTWLKANVPASYAIPHDHQCVWVQLNAAGVNFNQSSVRRNMDFAHLSELDRPATISGVGYPAPAGGNHDFLLMTFVRRFEFKGREGLFTVAASGPVDSGVYWLWIVHGYRRTGKIITIKGQDFEVLDNSPGSFGSIVTHENSQDIFSYEMTGGGIRHLGGPYHALEVPHNGSVEIRTRIAAGPPGSFIPSGKAGCLCMIWTSLKKLLGIS